MNITGPPSALISNQPFSASTLQDTSLSSLNPGSSYTGDTRIHASVRAGPLPDRAQMKFELTPVFSIFGSHTTDSLNKQIVSLQYLNYLLQEAAILAVNGSVNDNRVGSKRSQSSSSELSEKFVGLQADQVGRAIHYMGYVIAGQGNDEYRTGGVHLGRDRLMTTRIQGSIAYVPNIFLRQHMPDDPSGHVLQEGDQVGFMIKAVKWPHQDKKKIGWMGHVLENTNIESPKYCVQVIPVAGYAGRLPFGDFNSILDDGGNVDTNKIGTFNANFKDFNGNTFKIDWGKNEIDAEVFIPAIMTPVGRVERCSEVPVNEIQTRTGTWSHNTYELMKTRRQTIDLYLTCRQRVFWM